jgi:uncharacterized protein (TIGR00369 family)
VRPLTNAGWGFESNCFVCEPKNESGLRLPFFHDEEAGAVLAEFQLDDRFSGAPSYAHGGIVLAVLDEAMAWAAIAVAGQWAVTKETAARFDRPVRIGQAHQVRAYVDAASDESIAARAEIRDAKDRVCAAAEATFTPLGEAQAVDAIGTDLTDDHRHFLRSDRQP